MSGKTVKKWVFYGVKIIIIIIFILIIWNPSVDSMNRMWDTQFVGMDVAGEYINQYAGPEDRIVHAAHQSYPVVWYADRKGYNPPKTVEDLKVLEDEFNVKWIFMYDRFPGAIQNYMQDPEMWAYISSSYSLKQFAFFPTDNSAYPIYFLFQKGGSFNESNLNGLLAGKPTYDREYEKKSQGKIILKYINI